MVELVVAATVGTVAGGLAWAVAWWSGPPGTRRHRAVLLVSFFLLFFLGSALVMPRARAWKRERDVELLLASEPLFAAVLEDEPTLREPLRASLLKAVGGGEGEALLVGERLLSPQLWRSVPRASDAAALGLGRALVATLTDFQGRDPDQCYRLLYPSVAGPPRGGGSPRDDRLLAALAAVYLSARDGAAEPLDRRAAAKQLDAVYARLRERYGSDVDALQGAQAPGADRDRVCAMTIALYAELVALPPEAAGQALRHVLGPAELSPSSPARPRAPASPGRP